MKLTGKINPSLACIVCSAPSVGSWRRIRWYCTDCAPARAEAVNLARRLAIIAARPIRTCMDCDAVVKYPQRCCPRHSVERATARSRRNAANWRTRYPEKVLAQRLRWPRHPGSIHGKVPLMNYPFLRAPRDEHAELMEVNSLVPQIPGRADVVQEIMLALFEGTATMEAIRAGGWRPYVRRFYSTNHEQAGHAISMDLPRFNGQSWHDVLTTEDR